MYKRNGPNFWVPALLSECLAHRIPGFCVSVLFSFSVVWDRTITKPYRVQLLSLMTEDTGWACAVLYIRCCGRDRGGPTFIYYLTCARVLQFEIYTMVFNCHQNPRENSTIISMLTMWEQVEKNCNHITIRSCRMKLPIFSHVWWNCQLHTVQLCVIYCRISFNTKSKLVMTKLLWVTNEASRSSRSIK